GGLRNRGLLLSLEEKRVQRVVYVCFPRKLSEAEFRARYRSKLLFEVTNDTAQCPQILLRSAEAVAHVTTDGAHLRIHLRSLIHNVGRLWIEPRFQFRQPTARLGQG